MFGKGPSRGRTRESVFSVNGLFPFFQKHKFFLLFLSHTFILCKMKKHEHEKTLSKLIGRLATFGKISASLAETQNSLLMKTQKVPGDEYQCRPADQRAGGTPFDCGRCAV